jgi:CTP synthase (UTP-ammonia lyase)
MLVKIKSRFSEYVWDANGGYRIPRNVLGYADANSTEMNEHTEHPVVSLMEEQKNITDKVEQCVLELGNVILKVH